MSREALTQETLEALHRMARRHSRLAAEADDLVQDILLASLEAGRACGETGFLAWANGAMRNRAAFIARTAVRQRRRESRYQSDQYPHGDVPKRLPASFISTLPKAQRLVADLANTGLGRREIAYLLGLSDTALRQRVSQVRRAYSRSTMQEAEEYFVSAAGDGLGRRLLKQALPRLGIRRFAIRDPDGQPVFFSEPAHILKRRGNNGSKLDGEHP